MSQSLEAIQNQLKPAWKFFSIGNYTKKSTLEQTLCSSWSGLSIRSELSILITSDIITYKSKCIDNEKYAIYLKGMLWFNGKSWMSRSATSSSF